MQSSYNLIKNKSASESSKKIIETNYVNKYEVIEDHKEDTLINDEIKKSYEFLGENILQKAKTKAEEILMEARVTAVEVERKAYEEGYNQGKLNGFEDGYREGLEKIKVDTREEVTEKIEIAEEVLKKANKEYKEYLTLKEEEVIKLAFKMASIITKKELQIDNGILPLIEDILEEAKGEENIIIKCNSIHIGAIEEKTEYYKKAYRIKGEIFVLEDNLMEPGNAIIEKDTGRAIVGLDIALEKLEDALFK